MLDQILNFEQLVSQYESSSGNGYSGDLKAATIRRCSPTRVQEYLQLSLKEESTYSNIREAILSYECVTKGHTAEQLLTQVQATPEPSTFAHMEVDRIYKGGGKENYKGKKGGKHKGKGKGFCFHQFLANDVANLVAAEKANGKVRQEERKVEESKTCWICGDSRHWSKDCPNRGRANQITWEDEQWYGDDQHYSSNQPSGHSLKNQMSIVRPQGPSQPSSQGNRQMNNSQHLHPSSQSSSSTMYPGSVGTWTFSGSVVRRMFNSIKSLKLSSCNFV